MRTTLESKFRFTTMPTASSTNVGQIIQYTGETTSVAPIYTNGYFYKCVAQGTDPETYDWEEVAVTNIQMSDQDIEDIKAAFNRGAGIEGDD